ncbi:serine/threonine kinase PKN8 [Plesiocystis pacifica SIR-1]|uniref:Serine/threonine kinase PKN8 n=1 Tax=Plesiocystis pacifica SIR-1 TaxID=391625 RepID=A6GIZ9_9BACT|nr:serine/threonine-protein kinase [Plesiocystis pacifica]EDM74155.1 serine/threonine kinase PKN8 [Plesiocystis pacifica SIR-1]
MWSPSSSEPTPPSSTIVDDPALHEFAKDEGVPMELIQGALGQQTELSIFLTFLRSTPETRPWINERFELLEAVGEGSYGQVYRALDHVLAREVAIKIMRLGDPETADREARALAALVHPNVVRIYDQGREDDYRWIVMEWLSGPTLHAWCADKEPAEILARYVEAGHGLAAAHRQGLVHRDFKANNAMLDGAGKAMLVDFGLARTVEALNARPNEERIVGALPYLAPERLRGQAGDARSDQFAFCSALWEALAGANPFFLGEDIETRLEAMALPPRDRDRVPRRARAALERGLAKEPADRWPSMEELLDALTVTPRRIRLGAAGVLLVVAAMLILGVVQLRVTATTAPDIELPELSSPTHAALLAMRTNDHGAAIEAIRTGAYLPGQPEPDINFLTVAEATANWLEGANKQAFAGEAWLAIARLRHDAGDEKGEQAAIAKMLSLLPAE